MNEGRGDNTQYLLYRSVIQAICNSIGYTTYHREEDEEVIPPNHSAHTEAGEKLRSYCQESSSCHYPSNNNNLALSILSQVYGLRRHVAGASHRCLDSS